jgi:hypothetical protein
VKFLDATLASQEMRWCKDTVRPTMYGALGNFRPKSYGLEYRTLSNSWLNQGPAFHEDLFNVTKKTVQGLYEKQEKASILVDKRTLVLLNRKKDASLYLTDSCYCVNFSVPRFLNFK